MKLTTKPYAVDEEDVIALRKVRFDDKAILDIAQVAAYFNFVNRLACGLGIEIEKFYNFGV